ncbi:hypothetical protein [Embleya sp. NBC_00896]|uniref:hypothetical protein n=1 Tax=Embleya sp. NBC_00896 TaxID=2975961 RepID=UPI00386FF301|nr:hypothetical protein OG928_02035 [Embleya sp. NBC_00896]
MDDRRKAPTTGDAPPPATPGRATRRFALPHGVGDGRMVTGHGTDGAPPLGLLAGSILVPSAVFVADPADPAAGALSC